MLDWDAVKQLLEEFDVTDMPDTFWPARGVEEDAALRLANALSRVYGVERAYVLASMHLAVLLAEKARPSLRRIRKDLDWAIMYASWHSDRSWREPLLLELQRIANDVKALEAP